MLIILFVCGGLNNSNGVVYVVTPMELKNYFNNRKFGQLK